MARRCVAEAGNEGLFSDLGDQRAVILRAQVRYTEPGTLAASVP